MSEAITSVLREDRQNQINRKAVAEMDTTKLEFIMDIFKTLSTELPEVVPPPGVALVVKVISIYDAVVGSTE